MTRCGQRVAAFTAVVMLVGMSSNTPVALAITPPSVDPSAVPHDATPASEEPMHRSAHCSTPITVANPDVTKMAPGFDLLSISQAWQYSTGNGVTVAVIDTGVTPNPRLPVVPGGDSIMGGDGLQDCDSHGTIVASVIGAAPQGILPMPRPMPPVPAFPPPAAPPPATFAPAPPVDVPAPPAPPPPPAPVTITKVEPPPPAPAAPPPPPPLPPPPGDVPQAGGPDPNAPEQPAVPGPPPGAPDGVVGVAPHATILSIRQSSRAFEPDKPHAVGEDQAKAGTLSTLADAIVHAAQLGAKVINISVTACMSAANPLDQRKLGAALWWAATVKDVVIVTAAGNDAPDGYASEGGCSDNPMSDPLSTDPRDRDWDGVKVISSPSWFSDYVLSVGATDSTGAPLSLSMTGPWVGVAAPGRDIMGLSPQGGGPVNAYPPAKAGDKNIPFWGTSFSAAYVSGIAALVRAKYPQLTAHQVIERIKQSAHNPPGGVDNRVGYGLVDPVAALTWNIPPGEKIAPGSQSRIIVPPPPPPPPDHRARNAAWTFAGGIAAVVLAVLIGARIRKAAGR